MKIACSCSRVIPVLLLGSLLYGCVTQQARSHRPDWIANPKTDDSVYVYRLGQASGAVSEAEAKRLAYENALAAISTSIRSEVKVTDGTTKIRSAFDILGAEIMSGCVHFEQRASGWDCWIQVSYPIIEKRKIMDRLKLGEDLNTSWSTAKTEFNKSNFSEVKNQLQRIITDYEKALYVPFPIDEAKLLLGDACAEMKDFLQARQWYESIARANTGSEWKDKAVAKINTLPAPPRFWPLNDRLGGRKVGLLCFIREGNEWRNATDMTASLASDCREARLESADISAHLAPGNRDQFFSQRQIDPIIEAAATERAGVVLAILMDIDPKKRGKTEKVFDMDAPAIDTRVYFYVISSISRSIIFDGSFKEIAGTGTDTSLSTRATTILIKNYLVPKCPVVK